MERGLHFFAESSLVLKFLLVAQIELSMLTQVQEFLMDSLGLMIAECKRLAIDKTLDHGNLLYQSLILRESIGIDLVEILTQDIVVEGEVASLVGSKVEDGAAYLEKVLLKIGLTSHLCI